MMAVDTIRLRLDSIIALLLLILSVLLWSVLPPFLAPAVIFFIISVPVITWVLLRLDPRL